MSKMAPSHNWQLYYMLAMSSGECAYLSIQMLPLLAVCDPHSLVATLRDGCSERVYPKSEYSKSPRWKLQGFLWSNLGSPRRNILGTKVPEKYSGPFVQANHFPEAREEELDSNTWWESSKSHCRRTGGVEAIIVAIFGRCSLPQWGTWQDPLKLWTNFSHVYIFLWKESWIFIRFSKKICEPHPQQK